MNHPVPVSRNTGGVTLVAPPPQSSVTSDATSEIIRTTAGFARRSASGTDRGLSARADWSATQASSRASDTAGTNRSMMEPILRVSTGHVTRKGSRMSRQIGEIPTRTFNPGDVIFREGDDAKGEAFMVHVGKVEIKKLIAGEQRLVNSIGKGELLGELGLFRNAPRSATAIAADAVTLIVIPSNRLDHMVRSNPTLAVALIKDLANRMLRAEDVARDAEKRAVEAEARAAAAEQRAAEAERRAGDAQKKAS